MFLTWLTPVGLQRLSRHWDSSDRARRGGRDGERRHSGRACTPRRQAGGGERGGEKKTTSLSPVCHSVIFSDYLCFFPPFFLHFVPHQRLPPWQTSSRGCFFDSQCRPPLTTACVPPRALYSRGSRTHTGRLLTCCLAPSIFKSQTGYRGGLCVT